MFLHANSNRISILKIAFFLITGTKKSTLFQTRLKKREKGRGGVVCG